MKKILFLFLANSLFLPARPQSYWQQTVDYTIAVSLNEKEKSLDGFEKILYTNNSPDTLGFIWFHLWPNAYKNDRTAFSDQLLENGTTRFYFSSPDQRGYINRLEFKVDGVTARTEDHPQHIDIIKLLLPKPLLPGQKTTISTPFHVKLPFNFSRGGWDGESFQVTQWYPKPAVYDREGWHPMPYVDQGEFYSEFGSFDVQITVPENFVVAATGELQNEEEKKWLATRAAYIKPVAPTMEKPSGRQRLRVKKNLPPAITSLITTTKTLRFRQSAIHDFAWFADKNFIVQTDTCRLPSGKTITVSSYYTPLQKALWEKSLLYTKEALRFYTEAVGDYPYSMATVVQGPQSSGGGMEYPTITVISPTGSARELDATIAHELGHNWFYGALASNEREHPWMDEGVNSFYENKYVTAKYGKQPQTEERYFQTKAINKTDQPIETPAEVFSAANYSLVAYHKTAQWIKGLEEKLGVENLKQAMHAYYTKWAFRHPQPEDFKAVVKQYADTTLDDYFSLLSTTDVLPQTRFKGTTVVSLLQKGSFKKSLLSPARHTIIFSPAIGANYYDKFMIGGLVTNYGLPPSRFSFLAIPLYATGSKTFTGLGRLGYTFHPNGLIRKADLFLNASRFTMDDFRDDNNNTHRLRFLKVVPGVKLTLKEKNPGSTINKYVQWKTFLFNENYLQFKADSIITPVDTTVRYTYTTPTKGRYLNQLQFVYQNFRVLYPFDVTLQAEQAQDFIRATVTADYFFNYAKEGGLAVRFFAGKFSYLGGKTIKKQFANDRYYLNLTGAKGYEDYTYSNYFIGRNEFEGFSNQQLMIRDGGFKVRTDLLASKTGKTDDWLTAANFVTTIPSAINPLSVLPVKIPLRIFADVGTFSEAWRRGSETGRFLFDAGLQLSVLHEAVNIYVPLFYSKTYRDYFKSTIPDNRFLKTISFSIDLYPKYLKKLNRETEF